MGGHDPGLCEQLLHLNGRCQYQSQWVPPDGISSAGAQQGCRDKSSWGESAEREMVGEDLILESRIKTGQQSKL